MAIDPETKSSIDAILKMGGKKATRRPGFSPFRDAFESDPTYRKIIEEEALRERVRRDEERKRYDEEWRERRDREARIEAEHAERERVRRLEEEKEVVLQKYHELFGKSKARHNINLRDEVACLSINPSKACIVLRALVTVNFVNELERVVEEKYRKELDDTWEFHPSVLPRLKQLLATHYKEVQVVGVPKAIPATKFDRLMDKLDKEDRSKVYRMLSAKYHPDVKPHGSHEIMTLINEVFKNG